MDDVTQSTDVSGGAPTAATEASTSASPSVGDVENASQTVTAGDVTAQSVIEGQENDVEGTVDPTQDTDPLEGVPTLEELEQNKSQQYAQALINLRTAYEARKSEVENLKSLEPLKDLSTLGEPESIRAAVEAYASLFAPVINPETQQPEIDPSTGFPKVSATPFLERVDTENPGMAETFLWDALNYTVDYGQGAKPLYMQPEVREALLRAYKLDPKRLEDYRNIDAFSAAPSTAVTPEELEAIPEGRRDAYKTLPASLRNAWNSIPEDEQNYHLDTAQERLEAQSFRQQQQQAAEQQRQQAETEIRQRVVSEQESFVSQHLQQGFQSIMDDLAPKVTFSGNETENSGIKASIGALLFSVRDPDYRKANEPYLKAMGVELGADFDDALTACDQHLREAKAFELFGQKGRAQQSLTKAHDAKKLLLAKLSPVALKAATLMGGQMVNRANAVNKALDGATTTRPVPLNNGDGQNVSDGILPPGMDPMSREAGLYIAQRAGLYGG
jgi:hypothetical protein